MLPCAPVLPFSVDVQYPKEIRDRKQRVCAALVSVYIWQTDYASPLGPGPGSTATNDGSHAAILGNTAVAQTHVVTQQCPSHRNFQVFVRRPSKGADVCSVAIATGAMVRGSWRVLVPQAHHLSPRAFTLCCWAAGRPCTRASSHCHVHISCSRRPSGHHVGLRPFSLGSTWAADDTAKWQHVREQLIPCCRQPRCQ